MSRANKIIRCLWMACLVVGLLGCGRRSPAQGAPVVMLSGAGEQSERLAQAKGALYSTWPEARIIDVALPMEESAASAAAYRVLQAASEFPSGTIFLLTLGQETPREKAGGHEPILLLSAAGKYYLAPDNGILGFVLQHEGFGRAWRLNRGKYYHAGRQDKAALENVARDVLAPIAARLASGVPAEDLGAAARKSELEPLPLKSPIVTGNTVTVSAACVDAEGRVILNLASGLVPGLQQGNLVRASVAGQTIAMPLVASLENAPRDRPVLRFNDLGYLEIAQSGGGSAARQLRLAPGGSVILRY